MFAMLSTLYNSPAYHFFTNIANIVLIIAGFIKIREVLLKKIDSVCPDPVGREQLNEEV